MPRIAREKSESGIYHIMVRGINRQDIFHDEEDYSQYLEAMNRAKSIGKFEIYGYCLMSNHVHLLLHEKEETMASVMKRIGISYAWWYNKKYDRVGHVFQDRYKSETVQNDEYLLSVLRYIHKNPVKDQMVLTPEQYKWSSCKTYINQSDYPGELTSTAFILGMFAEKTESARDRFREYMKQENSDNKFLEIEVRPNKKSDESIYKEIQTILNGQSLAKLQTMEKPGRDEILRQIKNIEGATQRQIARVTGINQSSVFKA
jgi:REP element-mobilizing transposase RayT